MSIAPVLAQSSRPLGVVIPAYNEEFRIGPCLEGLRAFFEAGDPVVVVDAASRDGTPQRARAWGARVLSRGDPSRGLAVAAGYAAVAAEVEAVLVVHADMEVPAGARSALLKGLRAYPKAAGFCLGHRIRDPRLRFRWVEAGNRLRARHLQLPYGDQAQCFRVGAVEASGGFPVQETMEDLELALRLRGRGGWVYLNTPVWIPNRHWREGVVRTTLRNWGAALAYALRRRPSRVGTSALREGRGPPAR